MKWRKLLPLALAAAMVLVCGVNKADACHRRNANTCYTYPCCYYYPCYYYPQTVTVTVTPYHVWHVYQTNPVTGAADIVNRYLTKEGADADPQVVAKKAYVVEYLYYAT